MAWRNKDGDLVVSNSKYSRNLRESTDVAHILMGMKHDTSLPFGMFFKPGDTTMLTNTYRRDFGGVVGRTSGTEADLIGFGGSSDWFVMMYGYTYRGRRVQFHYEVCQGSDDTIPMHGNVGVVVSDLVNPAYYRFGPHDEHEVQSAQVHVFGDNV